jgi:hypothetical protein
MNIKIGAKVKFLNDIGGGVIKGYHNDKMVLVENQDGFIIPISVSELIIEESGSYDPQSKSSNQHGQKSSQKEQKKQKPALTFEDKKYIPFKGETLLAFVPDNDKLLHVSNFNLYLINDSNYYFNFVLSSFDSATSTLIKTGAIKPDTKSNLCVFTQSEIAKVKKIRLQGIFYKHGLFDAASPFDITFDIGDISFYKINFFIENDYFDVKALILKKEELDLKEVFNKLSESEIAKVTKTKEAPVNKPIKIPLKNPQIEEVDLHIEQIVDNHAGLSNGEIIELQLSRFETALETALRSNVQKIVFIHGVGNGKLKQELRGKLTRKYPDLVYQDASFKEYGFGATMVYLKKG